MEKIIRRRTVVILILLVAALSLAGCDFLLFPEGYRQFQLFSTYGGLLVDVLAPEVEGGDTWWVQEIYIFDNYLIIVLSEYNALLIYTADTFEKLGEYELPSGGNGQNVDIIYADIRSGEDALIITRNDTINITDGNIDQEQHTYEYTDFNSATTNLSSIAEYFIYDGGTYVLDDGDPAYRKVVDIIGGLQTDEIRYPDGFVEAGIFSAAGDILYVAALSGVPLEASTDDVGRLNIYETATLKVAAYPLTEIGSWKDNFTVYWDSAYSISSEEPVHHDSQTSRYAVSRVDMNFDGKYMILRSWSWGLSKIIDVSTGTAVFDPGTSVWIYGAVSEDGRYLYRAENDAVLKYTLGK